jgi:hypothetical protein
VLKLNVSKHWLDGIKETVVNRMDFVVAESVREMGEIAQEPVQEGGLMPVLTGFLRSSFEIDLGEKGVLRGPEVYNEAAGIVKSGDRVSFRWTAKYAIYVEFGSQGRAPRHFATITADLAPDIVRGNIAKAKARFP